MLCVCFYSSSFCPILEALCSFIHVSPLFHCLLRMPFTNPSQSRTDWINSDTYARPVIIQRAMNNL